MTDTDNIFQALERLEAGQKVLQSNVGNLQTTVGQLQEGQKILAANQKTLQLKVETFHVEQRQVNEEQKRANEEILGHLITSNEANGAAHKALEKRVDRIEKHLNHHPMK